MHRYPSLGVVLGQTACPVLTPGQGACPVGEGRGSGFTLHAHTLIVYQVMSISRAREEQEISREMCTDCFLMLSRCPFRQLEFYRLQCLHWSWRFHFVSIHWDSLDSVQGWLTCACAGLERLSGSAWLAKHRENRGYWYCHQLTNVKAWVPELLMKNTEARQRSGRGWPRPRCRVEIQQAILL